MSTKPTPETDNRQRSDNDEWKPSQVVSADFARKLERERDALRAEVEWLKEWEAVARELAPHVRHKEGCAYRMDRAEACDCGAPEALAAFDALAGNVENKG